MRRFAILVAALAFVLPGEADAATPLSMAPVTLFPATSSIFYSASLHATGGTGPYAFSLVGGVLPHGLTLAGDGTVSGVPRDIPGLFTFTAQALDADGVATTTTLTVSLATPVIALTSFALPLARAGETYRYQLFASGGSPRYIFGLADGSLPVGVELAKDGSFSGVPKTAGVSLFTVQVIDNIGIRGTQTFRFVVQKAKPAPKKRRLAPR
jgi:hypothetical protein